LTFDEFRPLDSRSFVFEGGNNVTGCVLFNRILNIYSSVRVHQEDYTNLCEDSN
jgi:hypothetical protein